jgi:hypothetical protein
MNVRAVMGENKLQDQNVLSELCRNPKNPGNMGLCIHDC